MNLLPCPFCGSAPVEESFIANDLTGEYSGRAACAYVRCPDCGVSQSLLLPERDGLATAQAGARIRWNGRSDKLLSVFLHRYQWDGHRHPDGTHGYDAAVMVETQRAIDAAMPANAGISGQPSSAAPLHDLVGQTESRETP